MSKLENKQRSGDQQTDYNRLRQEHGKQETEAMWNTQAKHEKSYGYGCGFTFSYA